MTPSDHVTVKLPRAAWKELKILATTKSRPLQDELLEAVAAHLKAAGSKARRRGVLK